MTKDKLCAALKYFCGVDMANQHMNEPQKRDGFYYASDGTVLIEIKSPIDIGIEERPKAPNYNAVMPKPNCKPIHIDISTLIDRLEKLPNADVCKCVDCADCDGGYFDHGSHRYECKECDGNGFVDGPVAKREKPIDVLYYLTYDGDKIYFAARVLYYLIHTAKLFELSYWTIEAAYYTRPCLFTAEGIRIVLCPYDYKACDDSFEEVAGSIDDTVINQ